MTSFSLRVLIHFTLKSHVPRSEPLSDCDLIREYSREAFPNPEPALTAWHGSLTIRHLGRRERRSQVCKKGIKGREGAQCYLFYHLCQVLLLGSLIEPGQSHGHLSLANSPARHKLSPPVERGRAGDSVRRLAQHPHAQRLTTDAL